MIQDKTTLKNYFLTGKKPTQQQFADMIESSIGCIGKIIGADMNIITDQSLILNGGSLFVVTDVIIVNPTIALSVARDAQIWSGGGRTGLQGPAFAGVGAIGLLPGEYQSGSNSYIALAGKVLPAQNYFSLGTPQGVVAKADLYIFGFPIAP